MSYVPQQHQSELDLSDEVAASNVSPPKDYVYAASNDEL